MKRSLMLLAFLVVSAVGVIALTPAPACAGGSCGLKPARPLPPAGCKDLIAQCVCTGSGFHQECHWNWICVPHFSY